MYRARDWALRRDVAIKVLPAFVSRDPDRLRRFEQEAQAAAALNHPNILGVHRFGVFDGAPYLVSELLEGSTLRELLRHGALPIRKAMDYAVQIARGLAAAHEKGIVHRDLKPENLFVTKDGRVKILDFGLAKLTQRQSDSDGAAPTLTAGTDLGMVIGTAGYMSPEQVRGQAVDHRTDIFAFGAILYEMLAGKRAFHRSTSAETMTAILNDEPPSISQIVQAASPGLQRVIHRCLEKNPEQRFQNASDLAFALEALSDASSTATSPVTVSTASSSKHVWLAAVAGLVVLVAALLFWRTRPPAAPIVEAITQLTDDGNAKGVHNSLQTDGPRIYFNEGRWGSLEIKQVAVTGGPIAAVPTPLVDAQPVGIAPDGSFLLVLPRGAGPPPKPAWQLLLPTGEPFRIAMLEAQDGSVTRDGRLLLARLGSLFVAAKDGSNPHKVIDGIDGFVGDPSVSTDGRRIVFTRYPAIGDPELFIANGDGSDPSPHREIPRARRFLLRPVDPGRAIYCF